MDGNYQHTHELGLEAMKGCIIAGTANCLTDPSVYRTYQNGEVLWHL